MKRRIPRDVACGLWGMADGHGRVELGWIAPAVLYMRCSGALGTSLGFQFADVTQACFQRHPRLALFCDAFAVSAYATPYKDAMTRLVLDHRARFTHLEALVHSSVVAFAARSVSLMLGGKLQVTTDANAFDGSVRRFVTSLPAWYRDLMAVPTRARTG